MNRRLGFNRRFGWILSLSGLGNLKFRVHGLRLRSGGLLLVVGVEFRGLVINGFGKTLLLLVIIDLLCLDKVISVSYFYFYILVKGFFIRALYVY